jgi:hypothetical protein
MDEISTLRYIAANPGCRLPPIARRAVTRLLRFELVRPEAPGYVLLSVTVETVLRNRSSPQWVREVIEQARESHPRKLLDTVSSVTTAKHSAALSALF